MGTPQKNDFLFFFSKNRKKLDRQESVTLIEISRQINRLGANFVDRRPSKRVENPANRRDDENFQLQEIASKLFADRLHRDFTRNKFVDFGILRIRAEVLG